MKSTKVQKESMWDYRSKAKATFYNQMDDDRNKGDLFTFCIQKGCCDIAASESQRFLFKEGAFEAMRRANDNDFRVIYFYFDFNWLKESTLARIGVLILERCKIIGWAPMPNIRDIAFEESHFNSDVNAVICNESAPIRMFMDCHSAVNGKLTIITTPNPGDWKPVLDTKWQNMFRRDGPFPEHSVFKHVCYRYLDTSCLVPGDTPNTDYIIGRGPFRQEAEPGNASYDETLGESVVIPDANVVCRGVRDVFISNTKKMPVYVDSKCVNLGINGSPIELVSALFKFMLESAADGDISLQNLSLRRISNYIGASDLTISNVSEVSMYEINLNGPKIVVVGADAVDSEIPQNKADVGSTEMPVFGPSIAVVGDGKTVASFTQRPIRCNDYTGWRAKQYPGMEISGAFAKITCKFNSHSACNKRNYPMINVIVCKSTKCDEVCSEVKLCEDLAALSS